MISFELFIPGIVIGALGIFFAVVLAIVMKKFAVPRDEHVEAIAAALPGLNCGGCGFTSCFAYAEQLGKDAELSLTLCKAGGDDIVKALAHILGREAGERIPLVAHRKCLGGKTRARDAYAYRGIETCRAASLVRGGQKACVQGCLSFGDCITVCTFGALTMGNDGLPVVDREKCVACGACVRVCPHEIFSIIPATAQYAVACNNTDKGAQTRAICDVGCIACKLCEKACPADAIHVVNNCAVIEYAKCIQCGKCMAACPRKIITYRTAATDKKA